MGCGASTEQEHHHRSKRYSPGRNYSKSRRKFETDVDTGSSPLEASTTSSTTRRIGGITTRTPRRQGDSASRSPTALRIDDDRRISDSTSATLDLSSSFPHHPLGERSPSQQFQGKPTWEGCCECPECKGQQCQSSVPRSAKGSRTQHPSHGGLHLEVFRLPPSAVPYAPMEDERDIPESPCSPEKPPPIDWLGDPEFGREGDEEENIVAVNPNNSLRSPPRLDSHYPVDSPQKAPFPGSSWNSIPGAVNPSGSYTNSVILSPSHAISCGSGGSLRRRLLTAAAVEDMVLYPEGISPSMNLSFGTAGTWTRNSTHSDTNPQMPQGSQIEERTHSGDEKPLGPKRETTAGQHESEGEGTDGQRVADNIRGNGDPSQHLEVLAERLEARSGRASSAGECCSEPGVVRSTVRGAFNTLVSKVKCALENDSEEGECDSPEKGSAFRRAGRKKWCDGDEEKPRNTVELRSKVNDWQATVVLPSASIGGTTPVASSSITGTSSKGERICCRHRKPIGIVNEIVGEEIVT